MARKWISLGVLLFVVGLGLGSYRVSVRKKESDQHPNTIEGWVAKTRRKCSELSKKEARDHCFRGILREAVAAQGTASAVDVLVALREAKVIDASFDDHQHVHEIGRETAKLKGLTVDAFLSCPTTYNYGCQHGFFEYALSQTSSHREAMTKICEGIGTSRPPKLYSYCYHGAGHGLMMALSYNLEKSLATCDELPTRAAQEGCWQGTLMENSNAAVTDEEKVLAFSPDDPLSPCNKLPSRYQWQCYINHAGYLMKVTNLNVKKAVAICLSAPAGGAVPCIQSIGLMVTNPIWQKSMRGVDTVLDVEKNVALSWEMCQELPTVALRDCVIGAIGNILNFDETDIRRATMFCNLVGDPYKSTCFTQIGASVASQVSTAREALGICQTVPEADGRRDCEKGVQTHWVAAQSTSELSQRDDERLVRDDVFLKKFLAEVGPASTIEKLADVMPAMGLSCHDRAHKAGRFAYELMGAAAFERCSSHCHSGCYHGAAEAFFREKGTANLQESLTKLCPSGKNRFFTHQCVHGVGHGLMAWSGYELSDALESCNLLSDSNAQSSCWTGVFMENIVGGLAVENAAANFSPDRHFTKYLTDDPHYPCNSVGERYRGSCYFLQTSRMLQLFGGDFQKIAASCLEAPEQFRTPCFQSMGRDVGGTSKHNVRLAIEKCTWAPAGIYRRECLSGAVQDTFWDPSGEREAKEFCSLLTDQTEVRRCYEVVAGRAGEVLTDADFSRFCASLADEFQSFCRAPRGVVATPLPRVSPWSTWYQKVKAFLHARLAQFRVAVATLPPAQSAQGTRTIRITDKGYEPRTLTAAKGTRVVFTNQSQEPHWPASNIHPTHRIYPEFDPQRPIKPGESWKFLFTKVGTWHLHDHLFPYLTGTITVVE